MYCSLWYTGVIISFIIVTCSVSVNCQGGLNLTNRLNSLRASRDVRIVNESDTVFLKCDE